MFVTAMESEASPLRARAHLTGATSAGGAWFDCGVVGDERVSLGVIGVGPGALRPTMFRTLRATCLSRQLRERNVDPMLCRQILHTHVGARRLDRSLGQLPGDTACA